MVSCFSPVYAVVVVVDSSYVDRTMLDVAAVDVRSVVVDTEENVPWAEVFQLVSA